MALSIVAGSVAFAGSAAASSYDPEATDGAGGNSSFLYANVDGQLPEGEASGNSNLTVKATEEALPNHFEVELTLPKGSDVTFADGQDGGDVEAVVFGEGGEYEDSENIDVTRVDSRTVEIVADYDGEDDGWLLFGSEEVPAVGVNVTNLQFDTGGAEDATLTWEIRGETADYALEVAPLPTELQAVDENGGLGAFVTAGAADQAMVGVDGASNLVVQGDEAAFPEKFEATLSLEDSGITFHEGDESNVNAESSQDVTGEDTHVTNVTETEVTILVTGFNPEESVVRRENIIEVEGLTYDVAPDADLGNVTWSILGESANYTLEAERLDARFNEEDEIPRGADQQPSDGVTLRIDGHGKNTDGFHASGENMTIEIPDGADGLSFDRRAPIDGEVEIGTTGIRNRDISGVTVTKDTITFAVPAEVGNGELVNVNGIRFNTTGFDERTDDGTSEFQSGLDVTYAPVDSTGDVGIASESEGLAVSVPTLDVTGQSQLSPDADAQSTGVHVNVTDASGGQMAWGEDIVIELVGDSDVTFDESQTIGHDGIDEPAGQDFYPDVDAITVSDREIVLPIPERSGGDRTSNAGDYLDVSSADGGLQFDTADANIGDEVSLAVTTNAGSEPVTRTTDAVATVGVDEVDLGTDTETITVGIEARVTVGVTNADGLALDGVNVAVSGDPIENTNVSSDDGTAVFDLNASDEGTITVDADGADPVEISAEYANITAEPGTIPGGDASDVTVTLTDATGDTLEGYEVVATSNRLDQPVSGTTNGTGQAVLDLEPDRFGSDSVTIEATALDGATTAVNVTGPTLAVDDPEHGELTPGELTRVNVTLTDESEAPIEGAAVNVTGSPVAPADVENGTTDENGRATLFIEPNEPGTIHLVASNESGKLAGTRVESVADIDIAPDSIPTNETSNVTVTVTGANDTAINATWINASGPSVNDTNRTADGSGQAEFTFDPDGEGDVTVAADELGVEGTLTVEDAQEEDPDKGDGGDDGDDGGGTGGGGGFAPSPSPDFTVTDVTLSATDIEEGETVDVTVTVVNEGDADGEYTVRVRANTLTVATETVEVPEGETVEVTIPVTFTNAGERRIEVDDVDGGSVVIEELEPEGLPAEAIVADARPVVDAAPDENGTLVEFDENVTVDAVVFGNASNATATVADLEALPGDVPGTPGSLIRAMDIDVPDELANESATVRLSLDASAVDVDADRVRLGRYHDGDWQTMQPRNVSESGGEFVYAFETPGFSTFAVAQQGGDQPTTPTDTAEGPTATDTPTDDGGPSDDGDGPDVLMIGLLAIVVLAVVAGVAYYLTQRE